jgi:hypothetical protein
VHCETADRVADVEEDGMTPCRSRLAMAKATDATANPRRHSLAPAAGECKGLADRPERRCWLLRFARQMERSWVPIVKSATRLWPRARSPKKGCVGNAYSMLRAVGTNAAFCSSAFEAFVRRGHGGVRA